MTDRSRTVKLTGAACAGSLLIAVGKLIMGIAFLSVFTCINAFYSMGMVLAKACLLKGILEEGERMQVNFRCRQAAVILILSSLLYMIYSLRLFWMPVVDQYHPYAGIAIAAFTFFELGINIRGIVINRHRHLRLFWALRMISFASSLICLVLTQTAILAFTNPGIDHSSANALIGLLMGAAAALIGVGMLFRAG